MSKSDREFAGGFGNTFSFQEWDLGNGVVARITIDKTGGLGKAWWIIARGDREYHVPPDLFKVFFRVAGKEPPDVE